MQLDSLEFVSLFWTGLFRGSEKKNNKAESFSTLFLISILTWITEKELERVKAKETNFAGNKKHEKNIASVRKREILVASKVKISGSEKQN